MLRSIAVAALFAATGTLCASPITLTFTQYFDYPGFAGHPSATWNAVFDLATHPGDPFSGTQPTVNTDFISDGIVLITPMPLHITWNGDKIGSTLPSFFQRGGTNYAVSPATFGSCNQPCTDVGKPDIGMPIVGLGFLFAQTPDVFVGGAVTVPEPGTFAVVLLGLAVVLTRCLFLWWARTDSNTRPSGS